MEKQRSPSNHKQHNNDEIDDTNDGENEQADDEDSKGDHEDITKKCDFDLNFVGTNEEKLGLLAEKDYKDLFDEMD